MKKFIGIKAKTYDYLIDDGSKDKEATQLQNKINHLEKSKIGIDSLKKIIKNKAIN